MKGYKSIIQEKLTHHLQFSTTHDIDKLFDKNTKKESLKSIIPTDIEKYHKFNEVSIERLEDEGIKFSYSKHLRIIKNKIKEIISNDIVPKSDSQYNVDNMMMINLEAQNGNRDINHLEDDSEVKEITNYHKTNNIQSGFVTSDQ